MNIRYLLRSLLCVSLSFCIVFSSSYSALASTTTEQVYSITPSFYNYSVTPFNLYDEDSLDVTFSYSIGDYDLDKYSISSSSSTLIIPINSRFNGSSKVTFVSADTSSLQPFDDYIKYTMKFSNFDDDGVFFPLLGLDLSINGIAFAAPFSPNGSWFTFTNSKPLAAHYRYYNSSYTVLGSGDINLNNIQVVNGTLNLILNIPKDSAQTAQAEYLSIDFIYKVPSEFIDSVYGSNVGFYNEGAYVYGDFISGSSSNGSQNDYNQNVEAELGNIQTGINNVINSVVQMGNQAWQGAQQTVQAVTQMTQQLNTAIDQQRQDILNGLGLLGDDIGSSLTNVKTEIKNMGSSITNKLESTTQSITNKIESTTNTITNTIENKVDEVTSSVNKVKDSVVEVKNSIIDLPNKLKEMLTGFFVPNEQTINSKYSEFDSLLSDRFGLIYQSADIIHDFADSFQSQAVMTADTGGIITMPQVTVSLAGTPFTFGGYEVDVIPDGFETLQQMCRLAVSMVCTVVFINMLKEKLEWILR